MLTRRILTVLVLAICIFVILVLVQDLSQYTIPLAVSILLLVVVFVFQHQINWWYYRKFPPTLPSPIHNLFAATSSFYRSLSREGQELFGRQVRMFVEAKEFIAKGLDEVPEDVKYMVAYYAVRSVWPGEDYLFENYGRIVIYQHPFLSPSFPEDVHTVEVEHTDGTLIFSMEHLLASFFKRNKYYQIGFHAFAEILKRNVYADFPEPPDNFWDLLEESLKITQSSVRDFIGLPVSDDDDRTILLSFYLRNPKKMRYLFEGLPEPVYTEPIDENDVLPNENI